MKRMFQSLLALAGGTMALIMATTTPAVAAPYQDWAQTPGNSAGVVFRPYGDVFELWDNLDDGNDVFVRFHYKGVNDNWKTAARVLDGHVKISRNVYEKLNGEPAYIYFQVCDYPRGCSFSSLYRTWGS